MMRKVQEVSALEFAFAAAVKRLSVGIEVIKPTLEKLHLRALDEPELVFFGREVPIGRYRADFVLAVGERMALVECDGFKYHRANMAQVVADARRDKDIHHLCGMWPLRIQQAEIVEDVVAEAAKVLVSLGYTPMSIATKAVIEAGRQQGHDQ